MSGWRKPKCSSGKVAFRSQGAAQHALDRIALSEAQAAVPAIDAPIRAYRCRCGAWHLTSQPKREITVRERGSEPRRKPRTHAQRKPRKRAQRKARKRAQRKAPARPRVLTLVTPAAPPAPAPVPVFEPSDPITAERRRVWRERAEELARLNAEERLRPRRAAA